MANGVTSNTMRISAKPPDLGAFPLDHFRECKSQIEDYYTCLKANDYITPLCRDEVRSYLQCRMDRGLMKSADLSGFNIPETEFVTTRQHRIDLKQQWLRQRMNQVTKVWEENYKRDDLHIPDGYEREKGSNADPPPPPEGQQNSYPHILANIIMTETDKPPVVLDNGTGFIKCGFSGANFPAAVFQTAVGRPVLRSVKRGARSASADHSLRDIICGDECSRMRHLLDTTYPIRNGIIQNMDDMCHLWDYAFDDLLRIHPPEHRLLLSEVPLLSSKHRCRMYEVMFEKYGFGGVQSALQGILSLFSNGLQTGVAVDSGEGISHCTPIFEGYALPKANRRVDLGGRNITEFLIRLMQRRGYSFNQSSDFETVRRMKERFCYATVDSKLEKQLSLETTVLEQNFLLPDGSTCSIGQERFEATEALFQPHLIDIECDGLSTQLWNCIQAADIDVRAALYSHVVLSGGSTMFPGMPSRLEKDMQEMFVEKALKGDRSRLGNFKLRIEDPPRRKHMVFLGGATLAALTTEQPEMWLSKKEWDEGGASAVRARFGA